MAHFLARQLVFNIKNNAMKAYMYLSIFLLAPICYLNAQGSEDGVVTYTETVRGVSFKMIYIAGGALKIDNLSASGNEATFYALNIGEYYLGETEVTQGLWKAVMGNNPSEFKGCDECPVERVNWEDAQAFITKLNELTGRQYRLPNEAEWEYAAKGGRYSKGYKYAGGDDLSKVAWYEGNSGNRTQPVATRRPNELGLFDMNGNVWEWCSDWYEEAWATTTDYGIEAPSSGDTRVNRGGSWFNRDEVFVNGAYRHNYTALKRRNKGLGFRLAESL